MTQFEVWNVGPNGRFQAAHPTRVEIKAFIEVVDWTLSPIRIRSFRQHGRRRTRVVQFLAGRENPVDAKETELAAIKAQLASLRGKVWRVVPNPMRTDGVFIVSGPDRTYPDGSPRLAKTVGFVQLPERLAQAIVEAHNQALLDTDTEGR